MQKRRPITADREPAGSVERAITALAKGALEQAEAAAREATHTDPTHSLAWEVLCLTLYRAGRAHQAIEAGRKAVALEPGNAEYHANLGVVLRAAGLPAEAKEAYRAALSCDPELASAHHNLGNILIDEGAYAEAEASFRKAIALDPDYADAWHALGVALQKQGHVAQAADALRQALAKAPASAQVMCDLATSLMALDQITEAHDLLLGALELAPNLSSAHGNLGALYLRAGRLIDAESATRRAVALAPAEHRWIANLGVINKDLGRFNEAERLLQQALSLRPDYALAHANLLFCLNYHPDRSAEAIFAEYRRFDALHARHRLPANPTYANSPDPGRRLRLGLLSPDLREHSCRHFIEPLLARYDRERLEITCYAEVPNPDTVSRHLQSLCDRWRSTVGLDDEAVARMIRADAIDVMMDLGGHTSASRLLALAAKPAPVQIAYLLGHGYTSGLGAMDAFLADEALAPHGSEALFAERLIRLPRIPLAYQPPPGMPEVAPVPAHAKGHITFGYFGRAERLNDHVIAAWAAILAKVPGSRLLLNAKPFGEPAFRTHMLGRFAAHGIDAERLELIYSTPQTATWHAYGSVDIALDPFPHNAGTTTIEALWLGVPVVSLADRPSVGRFGASILGAVGLADWVAPDKASYVALAVTKASDLAGLADLRGTLRARCRASPLCDGAGLVRDMEAAIRGLWSEWCKGRSPAPAPDKGADAGETAASSAAAPAETERTNLPARAIRLGSEGRLTEAADLWSAHLSRHPDDAVSLVHASDCCRLLGRLSDAEAAARRACAADPSLAAAPNALGNALAAQGRLLEAEAAFTSAIGLAPGHAEALNNRALVLMRRGQLTAAERDLRAAIHARPDLGEVYFNLANALQDQGRVVEAIETFRTAVGKLPDHATGHGMLLFCATYDPRASAEAIYAEFRRWNDRHARSHAPIHAAWPNDPTPDRRLRIGYVSPDFANKSARHFIEPMLAGHDRRTVEIFCYAEIAAPDAETGRLRALADHWRPTIGLSDQDFAALIRQDEIDILVDLGGHTARNRLLAQARKPAPVQIAHFLGHGYTSGLEVMDAFLGDGELVPPGAERLFSEPVMRLPRIPLAYAPPAGMPAATPLPALQRGYITFGHFGRVVRLNEDVVAAWSLILAALPRSRLVLNTVAFADEAVCEAFRGRFARHGIAADRLDLIFTTPQPRTWDAYAGIDIALDPFPHNAGTTTIEALWLGVPVVSLAGRPSVGRFGASILGAVGLSDWVAKDVGSYVALALAKAADLSGLARLRSDLRARCESSPLGDGRDLARHLEDTYRALWTGWCRTQPEAPAGGIDAAISAYQGGDYAHAWRIADLGLRRRPDDAELLHLRGLAAYRLGRPQQAAGDLESAIAKAPRRADWRWNLTAILRALGRLREARTHGSASVRLAPEAPEAHNNLASVLRDLGLAGEAEIHYRKAIALRPGYAEAWSNLAWTLSSAGQAAGAAAAAQRALTLNPGDANAHNNFGNALLQLDRLREAGDCFERAVALQPGFATAHSNLLFCLNYRTDLTADRIADAYRAWNEAHAKPLSPASPAFANERNPDRRLRIGYVSADFRNHAASFFMERVIGAHDRSRFEVTLYAEVANPDAVTERYKSRADRWRSTVGLSDAAVADLVQADGIDILVDLSGHTAGNRLLAFARRPAPVQVAHMIGSGTTTGLTAMDAFLADDILAPKGSERLFSERIVRLPRIPIVYTAPAGMPTVSPLPALRTGHLTFGCFSRTARINDQVVATWARILTRIGGARLVLNSKPFQEAESRAQWHARFAAHGVTAERIDLVYTTPQSRTWAAYQDIDIALDPFPHNAGTTTIEALWMGVPVVSLADRPPVGRFGASILGSVNLADWVADNTDAYVARALTAAADLHSLADLRTGLRDRFRASPLGGPPEALTRDMENAYRLLWRDYCAHGSAQA